MGARNVGWLLTATGCTVLACGAWIALPQQRWQVSLVLAAVSIAGAAWLCWQVSRRREAAASVSVAAGQRAAPEPVQGPMQDCVHALEEQLAASATEITHTRTLFLEAIARLVASFNDITLQVREQQVLAYVS